MGGHWDLHFFNFYYWVPDSTPCQQKFVWQSVIEVVFQKKLVESGILWGLYILFQHVGTSVENRLSCFSLPCLAISKMEWSGARVARQQCNVWIQTKSFPHCYPQIFQRKSDHCWKGSCKLWFFPTKHKIIITVIPLSPACGYHMFDMFDTFTNHLSLEGIF